MPFADIELIIQLRGSAMRWTLSETALVELWRGTQLLGTISGETVRQLVAQSLSGAALALRVRESLALPDSAAPARAPAALPPRIPPSKDSLAPEVKAARKAARRARVRKKLAIWAVATWLAGSLMVLGWDCVTDRLNAAPRLPRPVARSMP